MINRANLVAVALASALFAIPAQAATFSGTLFNTNPPAAAGGRCSPDALTVSISPALGASVGTSTFGDFSAVMSHCINPPLPTTYANGLFAFDFGAGDVLSGTYSGTLSATGTSGLFANLENYIVTGGTGQFANFGGSLIGVGTVSFAAGPPTSNQTITGTLAAVPEPSTWGLMLVGFGVVGFSMRRSRRATPSLPAIA